MGIVRLLLNYASVGEPAGLKWFLLKIVSVNCYLRAKILQILCKQKDIEYSRLQGASSRVLCNNSLKCVNFATFCNKQVHFVF